MMCLIDETAPIMHISDTALECSNECAQLAREVNDPLMRERLSQLAKRLADAARRDTELDHDVAFTDDDA